MRDFKSHAKTMLDLKGCLLTMLIVFKQKIEKIIRDTGNLDVAAHVNKSIYYS